MIKDKTLVAALPTAKVLFLSHYSPIQKEKGAYKNTNYPPRPSENLDFLLFITVLRAYKSL